MTFPDKHRADAPSSSITVRTVAGQLRVIPVWQALGPHAAQAKRTRFHHNKKDNFDEVTVMLGAVSPADLAEIAGRLSTQTWVVVASVHTAQAPVVNRHDETGSEA
ncbi:hypothetical protein [Paraburkholderia hospita]|uniref:hypothetical protein n=1 Tax=Paraburkholderia hospita TaxID=169430 RepID=UPI000DF004D7|nr:hypothetical protein [Paraburkholderia hospita]AXF05480.1 hypothetical protein CUJ88_44010 [Paraburkholderia hospita]